MNQADSRPGTGSSRLDEALRAMSESVEPVRDLWPGIDARLGETHGARRRSGWVQAAAAVFLVAASSLVTATLMQRGEQRNAGSGQAPSTLPVQAVSAGLRSPQALNPDYVAARQQLSAMLQERMERMPPSAREKLEANLAEMRRAADEINAALARTPGDPLLEELLLNTYQDELAVLASVNQLTSTSGVGLSTSATRIQL